MGNLHLYWVKIFIFMLYGIPGYTAKESLDHGTAKLDTILNAKKCSNCRKKANAFHVKDLWVYIPDSKKLDK